MESYLLKKGMQLGVASAATQCEGGELESAWIYWWGLGQIRAHASPAVAAQHTAHWQEDAGLLRQLGVRSVRLGVDWTRVEPQEEQFDESELARYRAELSQLKSDGMHIILELHHGTDPVWFSERGGFEREENLPCYLSYLEHVAAALGDLVDDYLTFAEPEVYALGGYLGGGCPPGKRDPSACFRVLTYMAQCHVLAYDRLHSLHAAFDFPPCRVSAALRAEQLLPAQKNSRAQKLLVFSGERTFGAVFRAFYRGESVLPMKYSRYLKPGLYADFLAVDWHGTRSVSVPRDLAKVFDADSPGEPSHLLPLLSALHERAPLPIAVTLGGTEESGRIPYLAAFLRALDESALPVERCAYAPFTDGFEWLNGQSRRLGLVRVDYDTQARSVTQSFDFFSRAAREQILTF